MKKTLRILLLLFAAVQPALLLAQYPQHFSYDDENGLPSNEIYSIVQDNRGFIWFGSDAGLFKFDGVRYIPYKCRTQRSKAITGLSLSPEGNLYCFNFQSQIFYIGNDSLKELHHKVENISTITFGKNNHLYVSGNGGISIIDTKTARHKTIKDPQNHTSGFTRSVTISKQGEIFFLTATGIGKLSGEKMEITPVETRPLTLSSSAILTCHNNDIWVFLRSGSDFYVYSSGRIYKNPGKILSGLLANRKITNVRSLSDGKLWITTYNGIIIYDSHTDDARVLYPSTAFSDCIIDREGNYWLSTLQTGIMRIPDLRYLVWNRANEALKSEKLTHLATDGQSVYFSSINGYIGKLNIQTNRLQTFYIGSNADIECFDYFKSTNSLYVYSKNNEYRVVNDQLLQIPTKEMNSIKTIAGLQPFRFYGSSMGLYLTTSGIKSKLSNAWCRQLVIDSLNQTVWSASNEGLERYVLHDNQWQCTAILFKKTQIISICFHENNQRLYALAFDGKIYSVGNDNSTVLLTNLPAGIQAEKIRYYDNHLYLASNKGVWIWDIAKKSFDNLSRMSGLASENVQDLLIIDHHLWLATGMGLQKIPLNNTVEKPLARIYLKNEKTTGPGLTLRYGEPLILLPEASIYNANGNFEYAYRVNKNDWIKLPATIDLIEIQNIPSGNFQVELKTIDHRGRNSENTIFIAGYTHPPFWMKWWFILLMFLLLAAITFITVRKIIARIRKREHEKNEFLKSQLKAIRAQMNPHFMYNTLNSIQDLILQHDIKNTNYYLSRFSLLMRQILTFSEEEEVLLSEETEMLQNYLELEQLRFGSDFIFIISIDPSVEAIRTHIPSLIVQPYVENAIKHGLLHKKGAKKLEVLFSRQNNALTITIKDNGIGRRHSAEIKQRSGFAHKSFAGNAVQKRVDLLNKSGKHHIEINIHDLHPQDENPGTLVSIRINDRKNT